jgi:hypothetical protein
MVQNLHISGTEPMVPMYVLAENPELGYPALAQVASELQASRRRRTSSEQEPGGGGTPGADWAVNQVEGESTEAEQPAPPK